MIYFGSFVFSAIYKWYCGTPHVLVSRMILNYIRKLNLSVTASPFNNVQNWCSHNYLPINVKKCAVMSTSNSRNKLEFQYQLCNTVLQRVSILRDLGIHFDGKLSFKENVNYIIKWRIACLGSSSCHLHDLHWFKMISIIH